MASTDVNNYINFGVFKEMKQKLKTVLPQIEKFEYTRARTKEATHCCVLLNMKVLPSASQKGNIHSNYSHQKH